MSLLLLTDKMLRTNNADDKAVAMADKTNAARVKPFIKPS